MSEIKLDPVFGNARLSNPEVVGDDLWNFVATVKGLAREEAEIAQSLWLHGQTMGPTQLAILNARKVEIAGMIAKRKQVARAVAAGYDPYTIPASFCVGFVEKPSSDLLRKLELNEAFVYNAPFPLDVQRKYRAACGAALFEHILVASADRSLFTRVSLPPPPPSPMYVDPFLVGLVPMPELHGSLRLGMQGKEVRGAQAFLIAQWDVERDLLAR